jgi:uroporphyrinogen-III synthase
MQQDRIKKVKSILITQPAPEGERNFYQELIDQYKINIEFRSFIHVERLSARDVRRQKVNLANYSAVIFNSRNSVDYFFQLATEMRHEMNPDTKYFSTNESVSNYIQKYITPKKRKMYVGKGRETEFLALCKAHPKETFLYPCSDIRKPSLPDFFEKNNLSLKECVIYNTVSSDLSDLENVFFDILVFFSPADIKSLYDNFPGFVQNNTRIAGFGLSTHQAIEDHNLILDIPAPQPDAPSMMAALEKYIKESNKR